MSLHKTEARILPEEANTPERLRTLLRHRGYWKDDRPDVGRFCREKGYLPQSVYSWLRGVEPRHEALRRLADDLACSVEWLVAGAAIPREFQKAGARPVPPPVGPAKVLMLEQGARGAREQGGPVFDAGLIGSLREVTGRLGRLEAALQAFFDIYPDMLLWLDGDGTILSASHGKDFTPPASPEQLVGKKQWDVVPADIGRMWKAALANAHQTGRPYQFETRIPLKGQLYIRECRLMPMGGHGFLAVIRDITELRELQEKADGGEPAAGAKE